MPGLEFSSCDGLLSALLMFFTSSRLASYTVRCLWLSPSARASRALPAYRVLHSCRVGICYQTLPLLPLDSRFLHHRLDFSGCFRGSRVSIPVITTGTGPLPSWVLTLQGIPLFRSFSVASDRLPSFRFDGLKVLALPG